MDIRQIYIEPFQHYTEGFTALLDTILVLGVTPKPFSEVHIVPFDKPHKDLTQCALKRRVSLINALSKALEVVVLNGLQSKGEQTWVLSSMRIGAREG